MKWARWLYVIWCAAAVLYLLIANMWGYVPFSSTATAGTSHAGGGGGHGTAGYYHK